MDLNWGERQFLATCLLLGVSAAEGDERVQALACELARRLGVDNELNQLACRWVQQQQERN